MKQPIKKSQIKVIHTLKSTIRMEEEDYRSLLKSKFNRDSSTQLSEFQADILINMLRAWAPARATQNQRDKIIKLCDKLNISESNRNKLIRDKLNYNITLNQLSKKEASKMIYILEKILGWKNE